MKIVPRPISFRDLAFRQLQMVRRWCKLPYPRHPKGCPNADSCEYFRNGLRDRLERAKSINLLWVEFNLDQQEQQMAEKHPDWTPRQCRNLLYWQKKVRAELRWMAESLWPNGTLIIGAEGGGVDFYLTMRRLGIPLNTMRNLHIVRVIGIVYENGMKQTDLLDFNELSEESMYDCLDERI